MITKRRTKGWGWKGKHGAEKVGTMRRCDFIKEIVVDLKLQNLRNHDWECKRM